MTDPVKGDTNAAIDPAAPAVAATNVKGSAALQMDASPPPVDPKADTNTAEAFGVTAAQFDKFYDKTAKAYNWENHAKELAWQMTQGAGKKSEAAPTDTQAQAAVDKAGLDMDALNDELAKDGKLSQASLDALAAVGIPAETATGYAKYITAQAEAFVTEVKTYLGGEQGMATLKAWAVKNLTADERVQYEKKLSDPAEWKVYADSLKARAGVRAGAPSNIVHGGNAQGGGGDAAGYKDMSELIAAQRNPKYKTDASFRAEVMAKARASTFAMNPRAHVP